MAIKLPSFLTATDTKSRLMLVGITIGLVVALIFVANRFLGSNKTSGAAKVANAPTGLQSVPGSQLSPEYYRAVMQANAQTAKQAQITGGSAVPTLINVPGQEAASSSNCTVLCPGGEAADTTDDINSLVKSGKLSQEDANKLLDLAKNNASVADYAAQLDELVKEGKLTPEQARRLLDEYKRQHANALVAASAQTMDSLIKAGSLPLDTATELLSLQKQGITPAQYAAELNRLVQEGKISPEVANQLLAQYTQQKAQEQRLEGASQLRQMAKGGQITPDVADDLIAMQKRNASVDQYKAELDRLVAAGKMTPATAAKLLSQYQQQHAGLASELNALIAGVEATCTAEINTMVSQGQISKEVANGLMSLRSKNVTLQEYQSVIAKLIQAKSISAENAQHLTNCYQKLSQLRAEAQKLLSLQGNNASAAQYADELKQAVAAGTMTPEMAARLLQEYQASVTPPPGVGANAESNLPGAEDFARLQERIAAQQTPPAGVAVTTNETQQFNAAVAQADTEEAQRRAQRIQELMAAMSGQAQSLIAAWAPPVMQFHGGSGSDSKSRSEGGTRVISSREGGSSTTTTISSSGIPIIKAGTILFATLDTAVSSDYPDTPVLATIISGKYRGAKVLGKLSMGPNQDRVTLNFNLLDMEDWDRGKSITAFAIDPDTARTALATSVDYHYLLRYGSMMGNAFISGYANAISSSGATTTTGIFGTSTVHPELSPASKIAVGIGQVGTSLGTAMASYFNTPPTVKVNAGVGLGILFMSDVTA